MDVTFCSFCNVETHICAYSHQTIKKDEFYALLSVADLGVITPLRDGMNTTSMEFVIAQERTKHSPLVLSEFMGISNNMSDALQVNPWNLGVCLLVFMKLPFVYGAHRCTSDHRKLQRQCTVAC